MSKYKALVGLSLPDGSRVEEGDEFDGATAGKSIDWLWQQGHVLKLDDKPSKPDEQAGTKKGD